MPIKFNCPKCGKPLSAPDDFAGRSGKCPGCGAQFTAPNGSAPSCTPPVADARALPGAGMTEREVRDVLVKPIVSAVHASLEGVVTAMRQQAPIGSPHPVGDDRLLESVVERAVDARFLKEWATVAGSADAGIERLLAAGMIQVATPSQKLGHKYRVPELKSLLAERGAGKTGNKADLIARLLESLPPGDALRLVDGLRLYALTPAGQDRIEVFRKAREQARVEEVQKQTTRQSAALACLRQGDTAGAGRLIAEYEAARPYGRGFGIDWKEGMPQGEMEIADYLLRHSYADLDLSDEQRREVGCILALSHMLGEPTHEMAGRLLKVANGAFHCATLQEWLRRERCGDVAKGMEADNPLDLAYLYGHTRIGEAVCAMSLKQIVESLGRSGNVEFLPASESGCTICNHGRRRYGLSELGTMPRLPRHWGCRCVYLTCEETATQAELEIALKDFDARRRRRGDGQ